MGSAPGKKVTQTGQRAAARFQKLSHRGLGNTAISWYLFETAPSVTLQRSFSASFSSITHSMHMSLSNLCKIVRDRGAWPAAVHAVTKSQARFSN